MALTWNPLDKAANITLSAGNLVATTTSSSQGLVRATAAAVATKVYMEGIATVDTGNWSFGWSNSLQSLTAQLGSTANGFAANGNGNVFFNNTVIGTIGTTFATPNLMRMAVDFTAGLVWVAIGNSYWNNNPLADPATGVGGYSFAGIGAGPYFPTFGAAGTGAQILADFGGTSNWFATPSGYSILDTNLQAYIASPKFLGYGLLGPPSTAISAFKFLGYGLLAPPQTGISAFKLLGYAILQPAPIGRFFQMWPAPRRARRGRTVGRSFASNPNFIPVAAAPAPSADWPRPASARRQRSYMQPTNLALLQVTDDDFFTSMLF